ncbi:MAG: ribosome biogenesis GTP-binding protein YihA/YsxC [Rhodanobacteraceae bacterium]
MKLFQNIQFLLAAHDGRQLPPDQGAEVAFAGRSNAGKSSALNALVNRRALARTSRTPGRTQQLVVFELDPDRRLVDLPGYGYAKAPRALRQHWEKTIERYLRERQSLRSLILIMDIRHPLKDVDCQLLAFCTDIGLPCLCLLTKADKLSRSQAQTALAKTRRDIESAGWSADLLLFSATKMTGVEEARQAVASMLDAP